MNQDEPHLIQLLENEDEKYIDNNVAYHNRDSGVNTSGSHVVHRLYKLKNDNMSLPDSHRFMKSTIDHPVGYDVIVADCVNKLL